MIKTMRIEHKFITLNKYINGERSNRHIGASIKKRETNIAYLALRGSHKLDTPCKLRFIWHCADKRSDLDNVAFSKKYILDAMCKLEIIPNDNMKHIIGFEDVLVFSDKWAVEIEVIE